MRILVFTPEYPNAKNVQADIFVHEQCKELQARGHEVHVLDPSVVVPSNWGLGETKKITPRVWDGVSVYSYYTRGLATTRLLTMNQHLYKIHARVLFNYYCKKYGKPDVIYAHFASRAGFSACEIGKKYGIPVVVIEHGGAVMNKKRSNFMRRTLQYTYKNATSFICVSNEQKKCVEEYIGLDSSIVVIPNMVNERFHYYPRVRKKAFVFFSAGNLYRVKRMDVLVRAFAEAFRGNEQVKLRIAGDGGERSTLEALIDQLNLTQQVMLIGRLNQENIVQEYIDCDVFALASEHESFGIAYREAMSIGRPVIATDNGGIREGWSDFLGKIVPIDDEKRLANAMQTIYSDYDDYNLKEISEYSRGLTSPIAVISSVEEILQEAVLRRK